MGLLRKEDFHESFWAEGISNPNLLINGDFQVWQRGTSFNTNNINIYTADRWQVNDGSANKCDFGIKIQRTNNNNEINFEQAIENIQKLKGKTLTLSWESKINKNMEIGVLTYSFTSNRTPVIFTEIDESYDSSLNIQKHFLTFKIPEDLNPTCSNLSIRVIRRTSEAELSIELGNIKLEIGDHPTQFIPRQYSEELDLCLRYYCRSKISQNLIASDDKQIMTNVNIPKTMRINPTATYDSDIYFHNLSDGNPILIGHKGDHPHSIDEYIDDCNIKLWICNSNSSTQITSGMCGVINGSDTNDNRLSGSAWIIFDAEIY